MRVQVCLFFGIDVCRTVVQLIVTDTHWFVVQNHPQLLPTIHFVGTKADLYLY